MWECGAAFPARAAGTAHARRKDGMEALFAPTDLLFRDRRDGGRRLARRLTAHRGRAGAVVLGLPAVSSPRPRSRPPSRCRSTIARRQRLFRDGRPLALPPAATVILGDDGIATGATVIAGIRAVPERPHGRLVLAVPGREERVEPAAGR
jgi:predicted phosphoribosyltransferase